MTGRSRRGTRLNLREFFTRESARDKRYRLRWETHSALDRIGSRCQQVKKAYRISNLQKEVLLQGYYIADRLGREYADRNRRMAKTGIHISSNAHEMVEQALQGKSPRLDRDRLCFKSTISALLHAARWRLPGGLMPAFVPLFKMMVQDVLRLARLDQQRAQGAKNLRQPDVPLVVTFNRHNSRRLFQAIKHGKPTLEPGVRPEKRRNAVYEDKWQTLFHNVATHIREGMEREHYPYVCRLPPWKRSWKIMDLQRKLQLVRKEEARQKYVNTLHYHHHHYHPNKNNQNQKEQLFRPHLVNRFPSPNYSDYTLSSPPCQSHSHYEHESTGDLEKVNIGSGKYLAPPESSKDSSSQERALSVCSLHDVLLRLHNNNSTYNREDNENVDDISEKTVDSMWSDLMLYLADKPLSLDADREADRWEPKDSVQSSEEEVSARQEHLEIPKNILEDYEKWQPSENDRLASGASCDGDVSEGESHAQSYKDQYSEVNSTSSDTRRLNEDNHKLSPSSLFLALVPSLHSSQPGETLSGFHNTDSGEQKIEDGDSISTISLTDIPDSKRTISTQSLVKDLRTADNLFPTGAHHSSSRCNDRTSSVQSAVTGMSQQNKVHSAADCEVVSCTESDDSYEADQRKDTTGSYCTGSSPYLDNAPTEETYSTLTTDTDQNENKSSNVGYFFSPGNSNMNQSSPGSNSNDEDSDISDTDIVDLVMCANQLPKCRTLVDFKESPNPECCVLCQRWASNSVQCRTKNQHPSKQDNVNNWKIQEHVQVLVWHICKNIQTLILQTLPTHKSCKSDKKECENAWYQPPQNSKQQTTASGDNNGHTSPGTSVQENHKMSNAKQVQKYNSSGTAIGIDVHTMTSKKKQQKTHKYVGLSPVQTHRSNIQHLHKHDSLHNINTNLRHNVQKENQVLLATDNLLAKTNYSRQESRQEHPLKADLHKIDRCKSSTTEHPPPERFQQTPPIKSELHASKSVQSRRLKDDSVSWQDDSQFGKTVRTKESVPNHRDLVRITDQVMNMKDGTCMMPREKQGSKKSRKTVEPTMPYSPRDALFSFQETDMQSKYVSPIMKSLCVHHKSLASVRTVCVPSKTGFAKTQNQSSTPISGQNENSSQSVKSTSTCHVKSPMSHLPSQKHRPPSGKVVSAPPKAGRVKSAQPNVKRSPKTTPSAVDSSNTTKRVKNKCCVMGGPKSASHLSSKTAYSRPQPVRHKSTPVLSIAPEVNTKHSTETAAVSTTSNTSQSSLRNTVLPDLIHTTSECLTGMKVIKDISANLLLNAISRAVSEVVEKVQAATCDCKWSIRELLTAARLITKNPVLMASLLSLPAEVLASHSLCLHSTDTGF